ncbi:MAG: EAL domain-containing protein [Pyrinomonadaceae bacterium]
MNDLPIKVLLIDDDEEDYILTKYVFDEFKDNQFRLEWINNFTDGLETVKKNAHDIVLLDYRLGDRTGLELLKQALAAGCHAPIILLTGQGDKEIDYQATQAGAADYLIKNELEAPLLERSIRYSLQHARTLEKMQTSESKFRSVIQSASDAIFLVNHRGEITLWNEAAEKIFGYSEDEIIGKHATILMGEKYARKAEETGFQKTMREVIVPMSGKIIQAAGRRKDSSEFPLELSGSIWKTNDGYSYTGIIRDVTETKRAGESLKESEERFRDLFENANDIIYVHDLDGNFMSVNQAGLKVFGYTQEEVAGLNIGQIVCPEDLQKAQKQIAAKIAGKAATSYEVAGVRKDGRKVCFEVSSRVIYEHGIPFSIQGIARDITDRKLAEEERDRLYNVSNDLLATIGFDGKLLHINPAWEKILGYETKELIEKSIYDITHSDDQTVSFNEAEKMQSGKDVSYESRLICKDGSFRWILWNSTPMVAEQISYVVGRNITERKQTEEILQYNALYDKLTDLPNRAQFMNHLQTANELFETDANSCFAVLFLDLDRFKIINDGLGHLIGDKLLVAISQRIKSSLRPGDVVARLGGDEFTLLIHNVKQESDATNVAERIQKQLTRPFKLDNYEVFSTASIGIIIADETKRKPEDFLRDADTAMYRAKASGKARYEIFDTAMHTHNINLLQMENDLRRAIERNEFKLVYQPIVSLNSPNVEEFEALIRWEHPEKGSILPNDFICIAEETGLIIPIGEWVLQESCRQISEWQKHFGYEKQLSISVNLSAKQLMHPNLIKQVREILKETKLCPACLKLEVTESVVMDNAELALEVLTKLCALGVRLSTDDFGTGYSSLSYLSRFPFERLKIDRSFVGNMDTDAKSEEIVRTIIKLAENLNLEVVAEGIENERQFSRLRELGCHYGQGYLFSKPVSKNIAENLLVEGIKFESTSVIGENHLREISGQLLEVSEIQ